MTQELEDYIAHHISPEPEELAFIDRETNLHFVNGRMSSGHIQGRILKMFAAMISPKRMLELGTFTGYSALCLAEGAPEDAIIDTVEVDDELLPVIEANLTLSKYGKKVRVTIGDALEVMKNFSSEEFDLIFIDADKRSYPEYLMAALPLLKHGGFLIADNTLWDGHVVKEEVHSSQTKGVMRFNDLAASLPEIETVIIPVRDGITIIRRL